MIQTNQFIFQADSIAQVYTLLQKKQNKAILLRQNKTYL